MAYLFHVASRAFVNMDLPGNFVALTCDHFDFELYWIFVLFLWGKSFAKYEVSNCIKIS